MTVSVTALAGSPQNAAITGGTIDGTPIGGTTPSSGVFTTLTSNGANLADNGTFTTGRYGSVGAVIVRSAAGTQGSPTAISGATNIGVLIGRGYDGAAYRDIGAIQLNSDGAISSSSSPGFISLNTTTSGATAAVERMRVTSSGRLLFNTTTDDGVNQFQFNGASKFTGNILFDAAGTRDIAAAATGIKRLYVDYTNTGTVGNVTINKAAGRVNLAAAGTTLTVTNSLVTANSLIFLTGDSAPGNVVAVQFYVVASAGSFTINAVPAVTNQTAINFLIVSAD